MRILITNDDGMNAPMLVPLIRWCRKLGDVFVVVPKFEQSAKSHSIEIHQPIEAHPIDLSEDISGWAVNSSPADCVRFAVLCLKEKFDLVISGVNRGVNLGLDMLYSGTVAAASEALALGIPALAISTDPEGYPTVIDHLDRVFDYIRANKLMELHDIYNINIPHDPGPILITHQGGPYYTNKFPQVGEHLYQAVGVCVHEDQGDMTMDIDAVLHGAISITPLTVYRTDWNVYKTLTGRSQPE